MCCGLLIITAIGLWICFEILLIKVINMGVEARAGEAAGADRNVAPLRKWKSWNVYMDGRRLVEARGCTRRTHASAKNHLPHRGRVNYDYSRSG